MDPVIRPVVIADLPVLLDLNQHLHTNDPELGPSSPGGDEAFARILAKPGMTTFLMETDGMACASCVLNIIPNLTRGAKPYGLIENVVTHEEYRGDGYGRVVLRHALAHAWDEGSYKRSC